MHWPSISVNVLRRLADRIESYELICLDLLYDAEVKAIEQPDGTMRNEPTGDFTYIIKLRKTSDAV